MIHPEIRLNWISPIKLDEHDLATTSFIEVGVNFETSLSLLSMDFVETLEVDVNWDAIISLPELDFYPDIISYDYLYDAATEYLEDAAGELLYDA